MNRITGLFSLFAICSSFTALAQDNSDNTDHPQWGMLDQYCLECHNFEDWAGEVAFDLMTPASLNEEPDIWEKAVRKLRGRLMPPPGNPQPEQARINEFVSWIEGTLDTNSDIPRAGHVPVQRMNRTEYARSVQELIGVSINAEDYLPTEIEVDGFDNIAEALSVSPSFLSQYISAARQAASLAVGNASAKTSVAYYAPSGGSQTAYQDGMPPGTRGGMAFAHNFPADGEYRFNFLGLGGGSALETQHSVVMLVDGNMAFRGLVGGPEDLELVDRLGPAGNNQIRERFSGIPVQVKAGSHEVMITFIERARSQSLWWSDSGDLNRMPRMQSGLEVTGPFNATGISMTPSREKIFVCYPATIEEQLPCAQKITNNLAQRAFRRPIRDEDMDILIPFFERGLAEAGFDRGIEQVVAAVLANPWFLYRGVTPEAGDEATYFALDDMELAARLSFFMWSQIPDEELLDTAIAGNLSNPTVLAQQVRRMLDDPRANSLVNNFAIKWLNLDDLEDVDPTPGQFPGYSNALRDDFGEETRRFMASILLADRPVTELMTADHTFLNERLARHYGIDSVYGAQFRRVDLADERRWGLLGKSAVLLRTSYGDRTSPVLRGDWVLEKLMGTPSPEPPPNVETDLTVPEGQIHTTVRARLEEHRANPSCNQCHGVIDPIGLALENYTVTGSWRDIDVAAQAPIDARTVMPGNIEINGPVELRRELTRRPEQFVQTLTEKLMMYALSRELEYFDMPQVRTIVQQAAEDDYQLYSIIMGIVNSDAFRLQARPHSNQESSQSLAALTPNSAN